MKREMVETVYNMSISDKCKLLSEWHSSHYETERKLEVMLGIFIKRKRYDKVSGELFLWVIELIEKKRQLGDDKSLLSMMIGEHQESLQNVK